jgi:hypothetical protein
VIIAFSAGAVLVATYLRGKERSPLPIPYAILICAAEKLQEALEAAGLDMGRAKRDLGINLPTLHIRKAENNIEPTGS